MAIGTFLIATLFLSAGPASADRAGNAPGVTLTAQAQFFPGSAAGGEGVNAAGMQQIVSASLTPGAASGLVAGSAAGATLTVTGSLIAGGVTLPGDAPAALLTAGASLVAGAATGIHPGDAAGIVLVSVPSLIAGAASAVVPNGSIQQVDANNRYYTSGGVTLPATDWTMTIAARIPADATGAANTLISIGPTVNPQTSSSNLQLRFSGGRLWLTGRDSASNHIGADERASGERGLRCEWFEDPDVSGQGTGRTCMYFVEHEVISTKHWFRVWVQPLPGGAPLLVGEQVRDSYLGTASQVAMVGLRRDIVNGTKGFLARFGLVSGILTKAQKALVGQGHDPSEYITPAAGDFFFLLNSTSVPHASTFGTKTLLRIGSLALGPELCPPQNAEAVLIEPRLDGHTFHFDPATDGRTITFRYLALGATGAGEDVQYRVVDYDTGAVIQNWTTGAPAIGAAEGTFDAFLPRRDGDYDILARKLSSGVPVAEIGRVNTRFAVGVTTGDGGQSLADHRYDGSDPKFSVNAPAFEPGARISIRTSSPGDGPTSEKAITGCVSGTGGVLRLTVVNHGVANDHHVGAFGMSGVTYAGQAKATVLDQNTLELQGTTFSGAYVSGGSLVYSRASWRRIPPRVGFVNGAIQMQLQRLWRHMGCRAGGINVAYGGAPIESFWDSDTHTGAFMAIHLKALAEASYGFTFTWLQGSSNIGQATYHADSGSYPSLTGFGKLGTLYDFIESLAGTAFVKMLVVGNNAYGGRTALTGTQSLDWTRRYTDWATRAAAAGKKVFADGVDILDIPPLGEFVSLDQSAHRSGHHYLVDGCRIGYAIAAGYGFVQKPRGPILTSVYRSGRNLTLNFDLQGVATALQTPGFVDKISGITVASTSDMAFANQKAIESAQLISATQVAVTLVSDPGAHVYVHMLYGKPGDWQGFTYGTTGITAAVDNGQGLIRLTAPAQAKAPAHGMVDDQAAWFINLNKRGLIGADGRYKVKVIDADTIDLLGSTFQGTFSANTTDQPTIVKDAGNYLYDDRDISNEAVGGQLFGMPVRPTDLPILSTDPPGGSAAGVTLTSTAQLLPGSASVAGVAGSAPGVTLTAAVSFIAGSASGGVTAITVENVQSVTAGAGSSITLSNYAVGAAQKCMVVCGMSEATNTSVNNRFTSVAFGGVGLTKIADFLQSDTARVYASLWRLDNPAVSTANIVGTVSSSSTNRKIMVAMLLNNVDLTQASEILQNGGSLESITDALTTAFGAGSIIIDSFANSIDAAPSTTQGGQTTLAAIVRQESPGVGMGAGASSMEVTAAGNYSMGWQAAAGNGRVAHCMASFKATGGGSSAGNASGQTLIANASLISGAADGGGTPGNAAGVTLTATASIIAGGASAGVPITSIPIAQASVLAFDFTASLPGAVTFGRTGTAWESSSGVLLSYGTGVARRTAARGLLIERAWTNELLRNSDLADAAWTATNLTPTADTGDTLDPRGAGNNGATKLMATAVSGVHSTRRTALTFTNGAARRKHVVSGFFKPNGYTKVRVRLYPSASTTQYIGMIYDLVNLTIAPERGFTVVEPVYRSLVRQIVARSDGWCEIRLGGVVEPGNASASLAVEVALVDDTGAVNFTGDTAKGVFAFGLGVQCNSPRATSSVGPVAGSSVARNADSATFSPAALAIPACTLFFRLEEGGNPRGTLVDTTNGGPAAQGIRIGYDPTGRLRVHVGNYWAQSPEPVHTFKKLAVAWDADGIAFYAANSAADIRGVGELLDPAQLTAPVPGASASLGHLIDNTEHLDNWITKVVAYPVKASAENALWWFEGN